MSSSKLSFTLSVIQAADTDFDLKVWTEDVGNVALLKMFFLQSLQRHQRWLHLNKILRAGFYYTFALTITSESPDDMTCLCTSHLAFSSALLSLLVSCCFYYPLCQERNNKNNHDALSAGSRSLKIASMDEDIYKEITRHWNLFLFWLRSSSGRLPVSIYFTLTPPVLFTGNMTVLWAELC